MPQPIAADDLLRILTVSDPRISPDGERVAFVVKRVDRARNTYYTSLYLARLDGSSCRRFTMGDHHDASPRWSPDGRHMLFVSDREGDRPQLYLIATDGGEARRLTDLEKGSIGDVIWAPDGANAVISFRPADERDANAAGEKRKAQHLSSPPREITRLRFREDGEGFLPAEPYHLYSVNTTNGKTRRITHGPNGEGQPAFSPDGRTLVFVSNLREDPDFENLFEELLSLPLSGGEGRALEAPDGPKAYPIISPDGSRIAYFGHTDTGDHWGTRNTHVWTLDADGGDARDETPDMDRSVGDLTLSDVHSFGAGGAGPAWIGNDRLLFLAAEHGATHLRAVNLTDGTVETMVGGPRVVMAFTANADGKCALVMGTPSGPAEVYAFDAARGGEPKRVSWLNAPFLRSRAVQAPEEMWVDSPNGGRTHGWILKPPGYEEGRRYPLILEIHGGPHAMYGWSFFHEMQYFAARGFVVAYTNPRGSQGYGEEWTTGIRGRWGAPDMADVMAIVDSLVDRGLVDGKRMGVTGGSYGGFLTAWIIGHTDRFAAAAPQRGVYNLVSMAGTCDFPWDAEYFGGPPWEWSDALRAHSPLTYAANVTTPTLILHSEGDLRCPIEQADQYYSALRTLRRAEVKYVRFGPEASHGLSRSGPPDLRLARLGFILDWMESHLT